MEMFDIQPALTGSLTPAIIQDLMKLAKKGPEHSSIEFFNVSLDLLWKHLNIGLNNFDDQLLCSTGFYSVLVHIETKDNYLTQIKNILEKELELRKSEKTVCHSTLVSVSLMYGMMQSSFLTVPEICADENVIPLLKATFDLLFHLAYEYTQYTYVVFKTIKSFQKVCGTSLQKILLSDENQKQLLNLINHNWENPITGIRDICKDIYVLLLSVMEEKLINILVEQVKKFYWNKAKFFMIAGIVKQFLKDGKDNLGQELNLNEGLFISLHKPGLVSAGADMYFEILKKIKTVHDWCDIFLQDVMNILNGSSKKAIENFNNYWYLATLKMFPDVSSKLIKEINTRTELTDEWRLYNILFLIKQRNKVGIYEDDFQINASSQIQKLILNGLENSDTTNRILAFEILCISNKKLVMSNLECNLVLEYLKNNVNSDCTVLRQNMLRNLSCFLTTLHQYYLNKSSESEISMVNSFALKLQEFIIQSLNYNGNYQRKITTVKILNIVITTLSEKPNRKHCKGRDTLINILEGSEQWLLKKNDFINNLLKLLKDPADDIRYNVGRILLMHYSDKILEPDTFKRLNEDAIKFIKSKFFFDINCGLNIFKIIGNLMLNTCTPTGKIENIEQLFNFGLNNLISAYEYNNKIVDAIFKGKQMHPFISLILVVLEVCHNESHRIEVPHEDILNIMKILEHISKQFACENATSTDFAQMNDLVENLISKSCHNEYEEMYDSQISGLHKLVLNSLWLNVKATCELASFLIIYYEADLYICQKGLKVITNVLETSRHKGAIEAAGASLAQAIQHLTSILTNPEISSLPRELLECKLRAWITEANSMASVTRRGAGMSIMVHRIVASDMQKGKPLFNYFMKQLLEVCTNSVATNMNMGESEKDLPKAIYIHFLTKIVIDSSLAAHTLFYSTELAEIAFDNLHNEHWQIRNAALQLYGALVPKLIGQKKALGSDEESVATVAISEFRTHFPKLWKYIMSQLINHKENSLEADSNLVPILNLLASLAKEYDLKFECSDRDGNLLVALMKMLASPIFAVRRLTAQCIYKLYLLDDVYEIVLRQMIVKENQLHGNLLLMKNFHQDIRRKDEYFNPLKVKFTNILEHGKHSFLCKELFETIFDAKEHELKDALIELYRNLHYPGSFSWVNSKVQRMILRASWDEVSNILKIVFLLNDYETHLEVLSRKISADNSVPKEFLIKTADTLLSHKKKYNSYGLWKILYQISLKVDGYQINFDEIMQSVKFIYHKNRYLLPLKARNAKLVNSYSTAMCIYMISFKQTEVELRYMAAIANNELANYINEFDEKTKLAIVKNAVKFLQDEDEDIRTCSVNFLKNIERVNLAINPFICLQKILNIDFIGKYFKNAETVISELKQCFAPEPTNYISNDDSAILYIDENNPFANDSENIYKEPNVIRELIHNIIK